MSDPSRTCANCGASIPAGSRFCDRCGTPVASSARPPAGLAVDASVPPTGHIPISRLPDYSGTDPLMVYDVEYPESLSRLLIFVKWLLAIPHLIILWLLGY